MKNYYDTGEDIPKAKKQYEVSTLIGMGGRSDPYVAFVDEHMVIFHEQFSSEGRNRGWIEEILSTEKEYFKRKLQGK